MKFVGGYRVLLAAFFLIILTQWTAEVRAKNILYIRIDTLSILEGQNDVILNVYYRLETTKPANFYAFDAEIKVDRPKVTPSGIFYDGTATRFADYRFWSNQHDTLNVIAYGGNNFDYTYNVLMSIRVSVRPNWPDSLARFEWVKADALQGESHVGIDTVIVENGWIRKIKPIEQPKLVPVSFSIEMPDSVQSGERTTMKIATTSELDGAAIKAGVFSLSFDTNHFVWESATAGALLGSSAEVAVTSAGNQVNVVLDRSSEPSFLKGTGTIADIVMKARKTESMLKASVVEAAFIASNSDNLIEKVSIAKDSIVIKADTASGQSSVAKSAQARLRIWPNPVRSSLQVVSTAEERLEMSVYDLLGNKVFETNGFSALRWEPSMEQPRGGYFAVVRGTSASGQQWTERHPLMLVH